MKHILTFTVPNADTVTEILGELFRSEDGPFTRTYTDDEFINIQNIIASNDIEIISNVIDDVVDTDTTIIRARNTGVAHRNAITVVDKIPKITITAADQAEVAGLLTAVAHGIAVAPANRYGTAGSSAIVTVTPTVDKSIDITIPRSSNAEFYDIFLSTDVAGPLWVARITEAERLAGCAITAVGVVEAGGAAGVVNVGAVGTGIASTNLILVPNNGYSHTGITPVSTVDKHKAFIYVKLSVTDLRSAPALNIVPFFLNQVSGEYHQGTLITLRLSGDGGQSNAQVFEVDVDEAVEMKVLVDSIFGQGASATIHVELV